MRIRKGAGIFQNLRDFTQSTEIDLFIVAGQSNATGQGATKSSYRPKSKYAFDFSQTTLKELHDPVGGATVGSAWPKFCEDYIAGTTRKVVIVDVSLPGSAQYSGGSSDNWDTSGSLYDIMIDKVAQVIEALTQSGITVTLRGILWCQGERDADQIDNTVMTKANYKAALENMITAIQSDYSGLKLYISQTGTKNTGDTSGFSDVRAAQSEVATASDYADLAFTDAVNFAGAGKMQDTFHYTTAGYEEMGAGMASFIVSDDPSGVVF